MRTFSTGATRDNDDSKPDLEGFISPLVTKRYGQYMHEHRRQADGQLRASDNWQKGIPIDAYMKSLVRHVEDVRLHHDGYSNEAVEKDLENALCAVLFNANGYLYELVSRRRATAASESGPAQQSEVDPVPVYRDATVTEPAAFQIPAHQKRAARPETLPR